MTKIENMKIEVWSDFSCPFCYMGKVKFEQALNEFVHKDKVNVTYKAFQLNPEAPKVTTLDSYTAFSKAKGIPLDRVKEIFAHTKAQAQTLGLDFKMEKIKYTNTMDAHRLAKWAKQYQKDQVLTQRFMKAYFEEGLDLSDEQVLLDLVENIGLSKPEAQLILRNNRFLNEVNTELDEAQAYGISSVPLFLVDGKYAISGAQSVSYFKEALNQLWQKEHQIKMDANEQTCDVNGC